LYKKLYRVTMEREAVCRKNALILLGYLLMENITGLARTLL